MGGAISSSLGFAIGIAASPIPIVAVILMLFSSRPRLNSLVFTATWVSGIALVVMVAAFIPGLGSDSDSPSSGRAWFRVGIGIVFLLLAIRNWRRRPGPDDEPSTPPWMRNEHRLGLGSAVGLGVVLSLLNPKDLALSAAGGAAIGGENLSTGTTLAAALVFTVIATSTVVLPVAAYLIVGVRAEDTLEATKAWLLRHNAAVMAAIWLVLGVTFLYEGISTLVD